MIMTSDNKTISPQDQPERSEQHLLVAEDFCSPFRRVTNRAVLMLAGKIGPMMTDNRSDLTNDTRMAIIK